MRLAYLVMGPFDFDKDRTGFEGLDTVMIGVADLEEAAAVAATLSYAGFDAIELSGAFGPEGARAVIEATGHRIPVGYVTHFPEDDGLFEKTFGKK